MATFYGTPGQDTINGTDLDDLIVGYPLGGDPDADESDMLSGGGGNDSIDGGGGFDLVSGDDGDDTLLGGSGFGFDELDGGEGNDSIDGQQGYDTLTDGPAGASGNDTLIGGQDPDRIITHGGADLIDGSIGQSSFSDPAIDTWEAHYEDSTTALVLTPGSAAGDYALTGGTSVKSIERIEFFAGAGNDAIVTGGGDDSVVDAPAGAASDDLITSGAGNDTITTQGGADTIDAGADTDVWFGHFEGESGGLTTVWDDAAQQLAVSNGTTVGNFEYMTFYAGSGDDLLAGAGYNDIIYDAPVGVGSNDTIDAGTGFDLIVSYGGIDILDGGANFDRWEGHYESASADLLLTWQAALAGWSLSDGTVAKDVEAVTFFSGSGNDTL
jgi:Ca2+-binding RTX toxin-like protein